MKLRSLSIIVSAMLYPLTGYTTNISVNNESRVENDDITVTGKDAAGASGIAIYVKNNGNTEFNGAVDAKSTGDAAKALFVTNGSASTFNSNLMLETAGNGSSHALQVYNNSNVVLSGPSMIKTSGISSYGVYSSGLNSKITLNDSANIITVGDASIAVYSASESTIDLGPSSNIMTSGDKAYGIYSNGSKGHSLLKADSVNVTTQGTASHGIYAANGNSDIMLSGMNTVKTFGEGAYGVVSSKEGSSIDVDGIIDITTSGDKATGAIATGAKVNLGHDGVIITGGDTAFGISTKNGIVNASNLTINTGGNNASAVNSFDNSEISLTGHGVIMTGGSDSHAISATQNSVVNVADTDISTTGENSSSYYSSGNSLININKKSGFISSQYSSSFEAQGGKITAILDDVNINNNGVLIHSQNDEINNPSDVSLIVKNTRLINGDILVESGNTASMGLTNTDWQGSASGATKITLDDSSSWNLTASSDTRSLNNSGVIFLNNTGADNTLTVHDDYTGEDGYIVFNGKLAGDKSVIDRLIVNGNTSGTTLVSVKNIGGDGDATVNGIELISVGGDSAGIFKQDGRIVAGVYDYFLGRGVANEGTSESNWYLTSHLTTSPVDPVEPPVDPVDPPVDPVDPPVDPVDPPVDPVDPPVDPVDPPVDPVDPVDPPVKPTDPPVKPPLKAPLRPEVASYSANLQAANTMFISNLHDRIGTTTYFDNFTGEQKDSSLWMKNEGRHISSRDSSGQLKTKGNRYVLLLGGDILQSTMSTGNWRLGVMAGYANQQTNTTTNVRGYGVNAKGQIHGYSAGLYGSWYEKDADTSGSYIDTWAIYSWFKNSVQGNDLQGEKYNSDGLTASVEGGHTFKVGNRKGLSYFVQPQAQAIWMGVKADNHKESTGAVVKGEGNNNVMTRLGVRVFMKNEDVENKKKKHIELNLQPFMETNWLHNTQNFGSSMNYKSDRRSTHQDGAKNILEVKLGIIGQVNSDLNLWGSLGQQVGSRNFGETAGTLGVKYNF